MNIDHIIILTSEPKSVFLEILFKYLKTINYNVKKKKITLIGNSNLILKEIKRNNYKVQLNEIFNIIDAKKNKINLINIPWDFKKKNFDSTSYIAESFSKSLSILKKNKNAILLNGPINKKSFLKKKYFGITEYLAEKTNSKNPVMLIYNKKLSVSPITTHLPIGHVAKNINKKKIIFNIRSINNFYKKYLKIKPSIAILGLNPHCETIEKYSEEQRHILPAIKELRRRKIFVKGPFSADTFFIKKNIKEYDVVIGMYHDQVLTPLKTLFNFDAINVTIGLPFIRVSPDHGPNAEMFGKNKSDPSSIFCAMDFFSKI